MPPLAPPVQQPVLQELRINLLLVQFPQIVSVQLVARVAQEPIGRQHVL